MGVCSSHTPSIHRPENDEQSSLYGSLFWLRLSLVVRDCEPGSVFPLGVACASVSSAAVMLVVVVVDWSAVDGGCIVLSVSKC